MSSDHKSVVEIRILKNCGPYLKGDFLWASLAAAAELIEYGVAEKVHRDIHNYSTR